MPIIYRPDDHAPHRCEPPWGPHPRYPDSRVPYDPANECPAREGTVWECSTCGRTWVISIDPYDGRASWWAEAKHQRRLRRRLTRKPKGWIR